MHFVDYSFHKFNRNTRTCHNTCTQRGQIKHIEHWMIELCNKHCWNSVKRSTLLFLDRSKCHKRVKAFKQNVSSTMSKNCHNSKYNTKTMEKRYQEAQTVIFCIAHAFSNNKTVINNIAAGKHYALWKACGS